jgi:hypothetical protein
MESRSPKASPALFDAGAVGATTGVASLGVITPLVDCKAANLRLSVSFFTWSSSNFRFSFW